MGKKLLLLIEDNPLLTSMYQAALEKAGFEVVFAHDGESGLALAREKKPDAIVLDILMPGMDGFAVLKDLKEHKETKDIKVIILTVLAKKEDIEKAEKIGIVDYLIKPELTLAEIVEKIKSHFSDGP